MFKWFSNFWRASKIYKNNFKTIFQVKKLLQKVFVWLFDDALCWFLFFDFPLLKKYNLKALLAIPSKYILDDTDEEAENRMNFEHNDLFENYQKNILHI